MNNTEQKAYSADFHQLLRLVNAIEDAAVILESLDCEIFADCGDERISVNDPHHASFHLSRILNDKLRDALRVAAEIAPDVVDDLTND